MKEKYCRECAIIKQNELKNKWLRENRKRDYDLFCLECNATLPSFRGGKQYCDFCADARNKEKRKQYMKNQKIRIKLDRFYKNIRINLIQSPYLIDRRRIELTV